MLRKLHQIFIPQERRRFVLLLGAIVAMGFFEMVGVASILPFMQLVSDPDQIQQQPVLRWAYGTFGFESANAFLFAVGLTVLVLLTLSNLVRASTQWLQYRTIWSTAHGLATRLLDRYLHQPYEFFLRNNSSDLGKEVLMEMTELVKSVLVPLTDLTARLVVSIALLSLLIAVDPKLAFVVLGVLGVAYGTIYLSVRRYVHRLGRNRYEAGRQRFKAATEALQGIKAVKVSGRESFFLRKFEAASRQFTQIQPKYQTVARTPRYFVETLAFGGILIMVLYLLTTRGSLAEVVPLLSLYALAGYRLLPALQEIFVALSSLRYHTAVVDAIHGQFTVNTVPPVRRPIDAPLEFRDAIRLRDVRFQYAGADSPTLREVSLDIPKNTSVAFVGPTGSGKTTLVDILVGLLTPTGGEVRIDGEPLTAENAHRWQSLIGYVPQEAMLFDDTIARNIVFGLEEHEIDAARVERAARVANIHDFIVAELPQGYETMVGERGVRLSGGQRQRIGLARALYREPQLLVLDEATSALDGVTEDAVMEAITGMRHEITMIIIAHRLTTVQQCDRIFLLEDGCITDQGTHGDLLTANTLFRNMAKAAS
jgi:ATP-binding cassette, subfamily B, bacterial PglK